MIKLCEIEGCNEKHRAKGLCYKHWNKQYYQDNKEHYIQYRLTHKKEKAEQGKKYRQNNKERELKRKKQWCKDNPKYYKQWREDNKKEIKQYRKDNRKKLLKQMKQYKLNHKKQIKKYYQDNREHRREYEKQWRQTPIGKASSKAKDHNRRVLEKGLTLAIVQRVYDDNMKQYGVLTCYLCNEPIEFRDDSLEHLTPLSRGGTNDYENLGVAHLNCNKQKHTMTLDEWINKYEC